jgi:dihydroflavonol-4-reductase
MSNVLVTGGCGFVGSHLVYLLKKKGFFVRVLDIRVPTNPIQDVEYHKGSILETQDIKSALKDMEYLYHVAANPNLWAKNKKDFLSVNYIGTKNVLRVAEEMPLEKIIYTSTESILSSARQSKRSGMTDETVTPMLSEMPGPYCRSKLLAEQEAFLAFKRGVPISIVNPTLPIGPGDQQLTPPSRMILDFLNGDNPAFLEATFNLIDVRDVAMGHYLAMVHGKPGQRYILGGENLRLSEILKLLERMTGLPMPQRQVPYWVALTAATISEIIADITKKPPRAPLTGVRLAANPMAFNTAKARQELGLIVRPVIQSFQDMIAWFQEQGYLKRRLSNNSHESAV